MAGAAAVQQSGRRAAVSENTKPNREKIERNIVMVFYRCYGLNVNGTGYCEWNYNGLGIDYQLLAGPSFILVFTIMGIVMGVLADKYNRVRMLCICTLVFAVAIVLQGFVTQYWHLVLLRMLMAAG